MDSTQMVVDKKGPNYNGGAWSHKRGAGFFEEHTFFVKAD